MSVSPRMLEVIATEPVTVDGCTVHAYLGATLFDKRNRQAYTVKKSGELGGGLVAEPVQINPKRLPADVIRFGK